ncbi:hypothetical protein F0P96_11215 [Hymenobacter busanensis]|uniref:Uncharacterized protein n=2 Tax=Hymenobacter busanensis TaxID=2607656 RepID=A0A7L5A2W2_9BACT|nr:hypothetical protein F0P96_11215 [Hymenobacter busanensis]QHJ09667.1 hypothetical protein GUY19_10060 [Hymenobacter busanensis]
MRRVPGLLHASTRSRTHGTETPADLDQPGAAWRARVPADTSIGFADLWHGETHQPLGHLMPDFVVRKKDGVVAYQLASVADDLRLGTTLIVRGLDLLPSTAAQLWLAAQLPETAGFNARRIQFLHHPLLTDAGGQKLSKSQQLPLERGILSAVPGPQVVYEAVAGLWGLPPGNASALAELQLQMPDYPSFTAPLS